MPPALPWTRCAPPNTLAAALSSVPPPLLPHAPAAVSPPAEPDPTAAAEPLPYTLPGPAPPVGPLEQRIAVPASRPAIHILLGSRRAQPSRPDDLANLCL